MCLPAQYREPARIATQAGDQADHNQLRLDCHRCDFFHGSIPHNDKGLNLPGLDHYSSIRRTADLPKKRSLDEEQRCAGELQDDLPPITREFPGGIGLPVELEHNRSMPRFRVERRQPELLHIGSQVLSVVARFMLKPAE